jgi:hypothetical protein
MRLSFGKHVGKELAEVPTPYLLWVIRARRSLDPALRQAIWRELGERGCTHSGWESAASAPPAPDWAALIRQWYRGLVLDFHPDRGGCHEAMQAINEAHDRLRKLTGLQA